MPEGGHQPEINTMLEMCSADDLIAMRQKLNALDELLNTPRVRLQSIRQFNGKLVEQYAQSGKATDKQLTLLAAELSTILKGLTEPDSEDDGRQFQQELRARIRAFRPSFLKKYEEIDALITKKSPVNPDATRYE
jgi:hypothetical protein